MPEATLISGYLVLTLESGEKVLIHFNPQGNPIGFTDENNKRLDLTKWKLK